MTLTRAKPGATAFAHLRWALPLAAGNFILAELGLTFAVLHGNVSPVWPASAFALAVLTAGGFKGWPGLLASAAVVSVMTGAPSWAALAAGIGVTAGAAVGAEILRRTRFSVDLTMQDFGRLWLAAGLSSVISPLVGSLALRAAGMIQPAELLQSVLLWYLGDAVGVVLFAPAFFSAPRLLTQLAGRPLEAGALFVASVVTSLVAFEPGEGYPYLPFLPLLWSIQRFNTAVTTWVVASVVVTAIWDTSAGGSQFVGPTVHHSLIQLYRFVVVFGVVGFVASAMAESRRRALDAEYRSENRLRGVFRASPLPQLILSAPTHAVAEVNDAFTSTFGWTRNEIIGRSIDDGWLTSDHEQQSRVRLLLGGPATGSQPVELRTRDGLVLYGLLATSQVDFGGTAHTIASFQDLTGYRALEQRLRDAQRMEAVGRLAGGVAHDFNNLLTVIMGFAELAALEANDKIKRDLAEVVGAAQRSQRLTQQLLAFGRRQVLDFAILNLNDVITDMGLMLRRLLREDVQLAVALDPSLRNVRADRGQVEQVLLNLVANARDAIETAGTVAIRTEDAHLREPALLEGVAMAAGVYAKLLVSDTGKGMDAATKSRVFEPFFTTKGLGRGTGLGLSTVYGVVKQSGGYVWIHSGPGIGTTVSVYLPAVLGAVAESGEYRPTIHTLDGTETILVVEDEDAVRALTSRILRERGYAVLTASTAEDALSAYAAADGKVQLLLTDVVLRGSSGPGLAAELTALRPSLRILYITGYPADLLKPYGAFESNPELIQKPFSVDDLLRRVREVLDDPRPRDLRSAPDA